MSKARECNDPTHISTTLVYMHYASRKDEGAQISAAFAGTFEMPGASATEMVGVAHD